MCQTVYGARVHMLFDFYPLPCILSRSISHTLALAPLRYLSIEAQLTFPISPQKLQGRLR
jgi:hypothetical protein